MNFDPHFKLAPFKARRKQLATQLKSGVVVLSTAREHVRNGDATFTHRFDSDFFYLTGFKEPEAVLVIVIGNKKQPTREILFCRTKDIERETWDGFRYGPEQAMQVFGFDEAHPIETLAQKLPELIANQPTLYTTIGQDRAWDTSISKALNFVRERTRNTAPSQLVEIRDVTAAMRLRKDSYEIAMLRQAANIASDAHIRAMRTAAPGQMEFQVEAELLHTFRSRGADGPAYHSIVAGGANACVLHYGFNNQRLNDGDLLLIDAGCEYEGYASDITRTFPVNGKFTGPQKAIYELVLESQLAAIAAVKPKAGFHDYHEVATRVLVQGFKDLKLCKGSVDSIIESGAHRQFYMHSAGHWLGLDVHDAGRYKVDGVSTKLESGMVVTVEPGAYIRPARNVPEKFWNIGIRIEDDVLVTVKGNEVLTAKCPKTISDVERACATEVDKPAQVKRATR
jgi:Xaa-Pro aminopeptidase